MAIIPLLTNDEHAQGVLPYQTNQGLPANHAWFFMWVKGPFVHGTGLLNPIRVYALDENLKSLPIPDLGKGVLQPNMQAMLPDETTHVIETSVYAPTLRDFKPFAQYVKKFQFEGGLIDAVDNQTSQEGYI